MITLKRFRRIEAVLREAGKSEIIDWSESIAAPVDADAFVDQAIYVICNSGMAYRVAQGIHLRVMAKLRDGCSSSEVFGHPGKTKAIDHIWAHREALFDKYRHSTDQLAALQDLPWIGPVTALHLAKNLGSDTAKPDIHMERLARREGISVERLCTRLSRQSGYSIATIDTILWRACADLVLNSSLYESHGWRAAFDRHAYNRD